MYSRNKIGPSPDVIAWPDKLKIINKTDKTLQCEVEFNRRLINKKSYGSAKGIWISTFRDGIWALQIRSMIPVSGTIS